MGWRVHGSKLSEIFQHLSTPAIRPTQAPVKWVPDLLPRRKQLRCIVDHPPSTSTKDKERVKLYLYSSSSGS